MGDAFGRILTMADDDLQEPLDNQAAEEGDDGCCWAPHDAKEERDFFPGGDVDAHPVRDRPDRGMTDTISLIVFLAMVVSLFLLWCIAFTKGQVGIAIYGMN